MQERVLKRLIEKQTAKVMDVGDADEDSIIEILAALKEVAEITCEASDKLAFLHQASCLLDRLLQS
jgi:hypothetical protein